MLFSGKSRSTAMAGASITSPAAVLENSDESGAGDGRIERKGLLVSAWSGARGKDKEKIKMQRLFKDSEEEGREKEENRHVYVLRGGSEGALMLRCYCEVA